MGSIGFKVNPHHSLLNQRGKLLRPILIVLWKLASDKTERCDEVKYKKIGKRTDMTYNKMKATQRLITFSVYILFPENPINKKKKNVLIDLTWNDGYVCSDCFYPYLPNSNHQVIWSRTCPYAMISSKASLKNPLLSNNSLW